MRHRAGASSVEKNGEGKGFFLRKNPFFLRRNPFFLRKKPFFLRKNPFFLRKKPEKEQENEENVCFWEGKNGFLSFP